MINAMTFHRLRRTLSVALLLVTLLVIALASPSKTYAGNLSNRSVFIHDTAVSAATQHDFRFDIPNGITVGSIRVQYCTEPLPIVACVGPTGLDASSASLVTQTGETGFSVL